MIRPLNITDSEAFVALRRKALVECPLAFASSPADDRAGTVEAIRDLLRAAPHQLILGAFRPNLIGMVGLYRDARIKSSHKVHFWGMYVAPDHRRDGVGSRLLQAALDHAGRLPDVSWVHLGVTSAAVEAKRLYERAGFEIWGTEPEAIRCEGETADEYYLAIRLE